jgi:hypothetical protein
MYACGGDARTWQMEMAVRLARMYAMEMEVMEAMDAHAGMCVCMHVCVLMEVMEAMDAHAGMCVCMHVCVQMEVMEAMDAHAGMCVCMHVCVQMEVMGAHGDDGCACMHVCMHVCACTCGVRLLHNGLSLHILGPISKQAFSRVCSSSRSPSPSPSPSPRSLPAPRHGSLPHRLR